MASSCHTCATRSPSPGHGRFRVRPAWSTASVAWRRRTRPGTSPTTQRTTTSWCAPARRGSRRSRCRRSRSTTRTGPLRCWSSAGAPRTGRSSPPAVRYASASCPSPRRTCATWRRCRGTLATWCARTTTSCSARCTWASWPPSSGPGTWSTRSRTTRCVACRSPPQSWRPCSRRSSRMADIQGATPPVRPPRATSRPEAGAVRGNGQLKLTVKDFKTDQEVRWCPGCGDYVILAAVQSFLPELGIPRERIVFISGIGCSSRFPYYVNTYGMHSIHGRAPALAPGLSVSRPDLSVWVVTGDGDALSIGGNHLIHALRRNVNLKILLFNNRIYGLTKGQYSPTSELGKITKSTPMGSLDWPFNPVSIALGAEATFVARTIDSDRKHLTEVLRRAAEHDGAAFVEIYQNCPIFNDGAFDLLTEPESRDDNQIRLEHGKPVRFGPAGERGVRLTGQASVDLVDVDEVGEDALLVHDEHRDDPSLAFMLSRLSHSAKGPTPIGVFRSVERAVYDDLMAAQLDKAVAKQGAGDLTKLLHSGDTWQID